MREILFRGKRLDNGEWVEGNLFIPDKPDTPTQICIGTNIVRISYDVDPSTIGQYTGLKDKNSKKIFEGDIFEFDDKVWENYTSCGTEYGEYKIKNYGVVGFDEDRSCFDFVQYKFTKNSAASYLIENHNIKFAKFVSEWEVIGNIHDNNELMKENNNG